MSSAGARQRLDAALREYERALADRAALETRIASLQQTVAALARECGLVPTVPFGLTDACRMVLRGARQPMTAVAIRDRLLGSGFDLGRYANPLAAIHTVLNRLVTAGELGASEADPSNRTAFEFLPSATRPVRVRREVRL